MANTGKSTRWIVAGIVIISVSGSLIYLVSKPRSLPDSTEIRQDTTRSAKTRTGSAEYEQALVKKEEKTAVFFNPIPSGPGVQKIPVILKENADRFKPILIADSIFYSPDSPVDFGNQMEFSGNPPDDPFYIEEEHNTVWYRFMAEESGQLTFDVIPVSPEDDYDFMLFKFTGSDFFAKVSSKEIKPLRTCISRNNKKLKGMTGLTLNEDANTHIHSGYGPSYVKYIRTEKGQVFYLLLDNVKKGNGHSVRFHYKTQKPGELYVGQMIPFSTIKFEDSDVKFLPGSENGLDSLYSFLAINSGIQIEIQGHVNVSVGAGPNGQFGDEMQLSQKRAETIKEWLVRKGIDPKRLQCKGYGSSRMKILHPKNVKECSANIRAEMLILSLDYAKKK